MQWTYMCSARTAIIYRGQFLAYIPFLPACRSITGSLNGTLPAAVRRTRPKKYVRELSGNSKDCQRSNGSNLNVHDVRVPWVRPSHLRLKEKKSGCDYCRTVAKKKKKGSWSVFLPTVINQANKFTLYTGTWERALPPHVQQVDWP